MRITIEAVFAKINIFTETKPMKQGVPITWNSVDNYESPSNYAINITEKNPQLDTEVKTK